MKRPLWRVNRPKGEQISHKGRMSQFTPGMVIGAAPHILWQYFLDIQEWLPYTHFQRKQVLIKKKRRGYI
jgi:hypothetical protein